MSGSPLNQSRAYSVNDEVNNFMLNTCIVHVPTRDINMVLNSYHIVSWELWQPLVDFFWHFIRVSLDVGHVERFVEVLFPRVSHWIKRKGTMEEGLDNGRLEGRPSSIDLRRFKPP